MNITNYEVEQAIYERVRVIINTNRDSCWKRKELTKLGFGEIEIDIILEENER